jgi:hypothetical protein
MRGTVHLITAADCALLRPAVQTVLLRGLRANRQYRAGLDGIDLDALADAARELVEQEPRTLAELRVLLGERWPDRDAESLAYAARCLLPLVQVPPRGIWGVGGQPSCTTAESWLGSPLHEQPALGDMVLRYLAAFGPASVADVQTWSGLTRLREVVQPLRERLWVGRDENGVEVFDLPDAPRPDPDTPAPVRLVAEFDNLVLSHADRSRVISDDGRRRLFTANGVFPGTVLLDGFVAASWRLAAKKTATLTVTPFVKLSTKDRRVITEEGLRMLAFAAPHSAHEVVFNALD